ncbi:hypothetical protein Baya_11451 [Bagarius yarrelli]|uniref:Uncharacterized protein n=1 Tax=Bagarius yarrelli TaxID=175774 RepID=A0A556V0G0_BAGYA|nr:hypothetical protein Baya_11451 [Bagarius yarrelli]
MKGRLIWLLPQEGMECHSGHLTCIQHQQLRVFPAPFLSPLLSSLLGHSAGLNFTYGFSATATQRPHKGFKLNVRTTSSPDLYLHMNNHKEMITLKGEEVQMRE